MLSVLLEYLVYLWTSVYTLVKNLFCGRAVTFANGRRVSLGDVLGEVASNGAYSFVYKGRSCSTGETFAVKKMYMQSEELQRAAKTEIDALKRFKHDNIIQMIDYTFANEMGRGQVAYLLFPFTNRGSLRDVLSHQMRAGAMPRGRLNVVLRGFSDICKAISMMHTHSPAYVHRDIKPENILFSEHGRPLLIDFGSVALADIHIANRQDSLRVADEGSQFCSVAYRAPELFDPSVGSRLDTRTDVWSLGCLLFAWYYGYSPFESEFTDSGSLRVVECSHLRVLSKPPRPPAPLAEDVAVMSIVDWILEKDFQKRPLTSDVIEKLDESLNNTPANTNRGLNNVEAMV